MNVKPVQVLLGLAVLALLLVVFGLAQRHWSSQGLSVELAGEPPLALDAGETVTGRLRASADATHLTIDGADQPLAARHDGSFDLPLADSPPGLHVARLEIESRGETHAGVHLWDRAVEVGVLKGPFEPPNHWHSCAIELHVRQSLLDSLLAPRVASQLSALKDVPGTPPAGSATAQFRWAGDGLDAQVHVVFTTGTDLQVKGHLRISVDEQHHLQLQRIGELDISGTQVTAWHGLLKARMAVLVSSILGGFSGEGFEGGAQHGVAMVDTKVRGTITDLIDEKLQGLRKVIPLPGAFEVEGVGFHWRYCRSVEIAAGRAATLGFDVEQQVPQREPAATFGVVRRPPSPVPPLADASSGGSGGNVGVDFSPALLDGLLDAAWRSGRLTELMNDPHLLAAINERHGDTQLDFKVLRVEPLLPPVLEPAENGAMLRMAETRLTLAAAGSEERKGSNAQQRDARLFAEIHIDPHFDAARGEFSIDYALSELASTCHDPGPEGKVLLTPCYADLLAAVEEHQRDAAESSPTRPLAISLGRLLHALPVKLSHILPSVQSSAGQPWFRVTADLALEDPPAAAHGAPHH